jgi:hypothetical protein
MPPKHKWTGVKKPRQYRFKKDKDGVARMWHKATMASKQKEGEVLTQRNCLWKPFKGDKVVPDKKEWPTIDELNKGARKPIDYKSLEKLIDNLAYKMSPEENEDWKVRLAGWKQGEQESCRRCLEIRTIMMTNGTRKRDGKEDSKKKGKLKREAEKMLNEHRDEMKSDPNAAHEAYITAIMRMITKEDEPEVMPMELEQEEDVVEDADAKEERENKVRLDAEFFGEEMKGVLPDDENDQVVVGNLPKMLKGLEVGNMLFMLPGDKNDRFWAGELVSWNPATPAGVVGFYGNPLRKKQKNTSYDNTDQPFFPIYNKEVKTMNADGVEEVTRVFQGAWDKAENKKNWIAFQEPIEPGNILYWATKEDCFKTGKTTKNKLRAKVIRDIFKRLHVYKELNQPIEG